MESDIMRVHFKTDTSKINQDIQIVIEENEALRTGMHEIMDSIRNQDGEFPLSLMVHFSVAHIFIFMTL